MRFAFVMLIYFVLAGLSWAADVQGWVTPSPARFWAFGALSVTVPLFIAILLWRPK